MKKTLIKISSSIMMVLLMIPCLMLTNVKTYAAELTNDDVLLDYGFVNEDLERLSDYTKNELVNQIQNSDGFEYKIVTMSETNDSLIQTRGQIPDEDLTLIITSQINKIEDNKVDEIKVKVYYEWENLPVWRLEDPIVIEWDENKLEYKSGSFYSEDRYYREDDGDALHVSRTNYYDKNLSAFCWYADLKAGYFLGIGGTIDRLYGFGEIILKTKDDYKYYATSNIKTTYVHSKLTVETGISFYAEVGCEIPGTGNDQISTDIDARWNRPICLTPVDYGFEQQYFFYEKNKSLTIDGTTLNTARLRCGYIEEEYINLSPRRAGAGEAYLIYSFSIDVIQINVDLALWSNSEILYNTDSSALIQYKNLNGQWVTILDLLNDISLTTNRNTPNNYVIVFPDNVREVRFHLTSTATGDRNKGRLCIGNMEIFVER